MLGDRKSLTLYEGMQGMLENTFMNIKNRSSKITAELEIPAGRANGAILSQGGRFGGWSLYMKDGKPAYIYNFLGLSRYTVTAPQALPPGPVTVTLDFAYDGGGPGKGGKATLYVNGKAGRRGTRREDAAQYLLGRRDGRRRHRQSDAGRRGHRHRRGDSIHRQDQQDHARSEVEVGSSLADEGWDAMTMLDWQEGRTYEIAPGTKLRILPADSLEVFTRRQSRARRRDA